MNPYQIERFNNRQLDMRITFMDDESEKSFLLTIGVNLDIIIAAIKAKTLSDVLNAENLNEATKTELRNIANNAREIYRHMNMIISNANVLTAGKCLMF